MMCLSQQYTFTVTEGSVVSLVWVRELKTKVLPRLMGPDFSLHQIISIFVYVLFTNEILCSCSVFIWLCNMYSAYKAWPCSLLS